MLRHLIQSRLGNSKEIIQFKSSFATLIRLQDMVVTTRSKSEHRYKESLADVVNNLKATCLHQPSTSQHPPPKPVSTKPAAILVPLFEDTHTGAIHVLLTQRSSTLNTHAGEVCLPGGKREDQDADDIATALRETHEELGIHPNHISIIGTLPPILSKHFLSVTPVLATIPHNLEFNNNNNPGEVSAVFSVPLSCFLTSKGGGYSCRDVEWEPGIKYRLHFFDIKYRNDGVVYKVWGLTAGVLIQIAEMAYNRRADFLVNPPNCPSYTLLTYEDGKLGFRPDEDDGICLD